MRGPKFIYLFSQPPIPFLLFEPVIHMLGISVVLLFLASNLFEYLRENSSHLGLMIQGEFAINDSSFE